MGEITSLRDYLPKSGIPSFFYSAQMWMFEEALDWF